MVYSLFAATEKSGLPLNINLEAYIVQIISFILVFLLLRKFAIGPIVKMLEKRRKTIDDGVRAGLLIQQEKEAFEKDMKKQMSQARKNADGIVGNAEKEARDIMREAEEAAKRKSDAMFADAEARIKEDVELSHRQLEKDIVQLVADATEAVVGEKVDVKKDSALIKKVLKKHKKVA